MSLGCWAEAALLWHISMSHKLRCAVTLLR